MHSASGAFSEIGRKEKGAVNSTAPLFFTQPKLWSGREDLNLRPQRPERCALNQAALLPAVKYYILKAPRRQHTLSARKERFGFAVFTLGD